MSKTATGAGRTLLWVAVGTVLGTTGGELLARLLPSNGLTRLLTSSVPFGATHPLTLDVRVVELTFGLLFRLNLCGLAGALLVLVAHFRRS